MRNKIRKAIQTMKRTAQNTAEAARPQKRKASRAIRNSFSLWMDRSKDFVSTFPTATELREELADWHSYEPLNLHELAIS